MEGIIGRLSRQSTVRASYGLNLWGRLHYRSYSTARKIEGMTNKKMGKLLSFNEFKDRHVESWESFKESTAAKTIYGNDLEKVSRAYNRFCLSEYSQYKHHANGGNPSLMI